MKKVILSLGLVLIYTLPGWAANTIPESETITIQAGLQNQSMNHKEALKRYEIEKIDPQQATLTNLLPFGVGSFQQGDTLGGVLISTVDIAALGLIGYGLSSGNGWGMIVGIGWGLPVYGLGRLIGAASPARHANIHNSKLRKSLGLEQTHIGYKIDPNQKNTYSKTMISYNHSF